MTKRTAIIYGTRPEFLKVFPLILQFRKNNTDVCIINTGQHDSMLTEMEKSFDVTPDFSLSVQSRDFTNSNLIAKLINELSEVVHSENIENIVAQGDTFTVLTSSIVAFMEQRKFFHIEAGLRTSTIKLPFPEEYNRRVVSIGSDMNFAPTELSKNNLLREGIDEQKILLTGNTIVDMIQYVLEKEQLEITSENQVFITAHRRENIGQPLVNISQAIKELAQENPETEFHWALHPNPNARKIILDVFSDDLPNNIVFTEPLGYVEAIRKIAKSKLIISDSGGIQEEAPSLKKRVLILRNETERPEVLQNDIGILTGTNKEKIKNDYYFTVSKQLDFDRVNNPFGDGKAAVRIFEKLTES